MAECFKTAYRMGIHREKVKGGKMAFEVRVWQKESMAHRSVTAIAAQSRAEDLISALGLPEETVSLACAMIRDGEKAFTLYRLDGEARRRLTVILLGERRSRHMPEQDVFGLGKKLSDKCYDDDGAFVVALDDGRVEAYEGILGMIVRKSPEYSRKTEKPIQTHSHVVEMASDIDAAGLCRLRAVARILPMTARLVDMPTMELTTEDFSRFVFEEGARLGLEVREICGEDLRTQGFGGLYHVGKSGVKPPRLVVVQYRSKSPRHKIALVGKGLVYDTGGLCLKPRDHMATMKSDMGGAAAVFGAICMAAETSLDCDITAILCMAENGIGPMALRPDDIITLHSGLTVEINNTDAEGRLVLGDGVSYASREIVPDLIVDAATLTGAQLMCTGKRHAGLLARTEFLERAIVDASMACGEPVFPMLYAPEMLLDEFKSDVADMKNSCKDRMNAQSSCAGHFVEKHLSPDYQGAYAHIDIAGPAWDGERATGYGVLLLDAICRMERF